MMNHAVKKSEVFLNTAYPFGPNTDICDCDESLWKSQHLTQMIQFSKNQTGTVAIDLCIYQNSGLKKVHFCESNGSDLFIRNQNESKTISACLFEFLAEKRR